MSIEATTVPAPATVPTSEATSAPNGTQPEERDGIPNSTKMSRAVELYRRMTRKKGVTRKEIVSALVDEVGLTKSGAATYYQMIKKGRR